MARKNIDHIRIGNTKEGGYRLFCLHCGEHYDPELPISMNMFLAVVNTFKKEHRNHEPGEKVWTAEEIMERSYPVKARL